MKINLPSFFSRFNTQYFLSSPESGRGFYLLIFVFLLFFLLTIFVTIYLRKKAKQEEPYKKFSKNFLWSNITLNVISFFYLFFRYEKLNLLNWRVWEYLLIILFVGLNTYFYFYYKGRLQEELRDFQVKKRKEKWLQKKKKK